jgi:hypothetical protein
MARVSLSTAYVAPTSAPIPAVSQHERSAGRPPVKLDGYCAILSNDRPILYAVISGNKRGTGGMSGGAMRMYKGVHSGVICAAYKR